MYIMQHFARPRRVGAKRKQSFYDSVADVRVVPIRKRWSKLARVKWTSVSGARLYIDLHEIYFATDALRMRGKIVDASATHRTPWSDKSRKSFTMSIVQ